MKSKPVARWSRLVLTACVLILAIALVWQGISFLARDGQALAPTTGQYYVGDSWMATPTALVAVVTTPTPLPMPTILPVREPSPTPVPTPATAPVKLTPGVTPTPDTFLVDVARQHGIDPAGTYIVVNQNAQRLAVVEDGLLVRTVPISSGDPDRGWYTPGWSGKVGPYWGTFTANGVTADDAWYLFQAGGSILIHSVPYTIAPDGSKSYQGLEDLGVFPASRGCIRIAPEEAQWLTQWGPYDVPIVVLPWDSGTGREG
jgi:lipoprotein-anchoring transpeptidase ErfK/SrfK